MVFKVLFSLFGIIAMLIIAILSSGGTPYMYFDLASILAVCGSAFFVLYLSWPLSEMGKAFTAPFSKTSDVIAVRKSLAFFGSLKTALVWSGVLAMITGFVALLRSAATIDMNRLGANVAVAILSVFWATFPAVLVCLPFESAARKRLAELE